ncbi:MAG TPA: sigma-54 dependent transcriptional regulator [Bryobacterales bacterium]|nr:sigma-54 dependent transcriptional regulator [Bryobacterales bacterium]
MSTTTLNRTGGQHCLLLVGPDSSHQDYLHSLLEAKGFRIVRAQTLSEACQKLVIVEPDVLLADLPGAELLDPLHSPLPLLERAQRQSVATPAIFLTSQLDDWGPAVETLKRAGASFLAKPVLADELWDLIAQALRGRQVAQEMAREAAGALPGARPASFSPAAAPTRELSPQDVVLGRSAAIQRVLEQVRLVAPKNTTVLITGETGTGKERISRAIHRFSDRRKLPMISVNCGGIPATLLEDEFFGHVKGAFTDAHQARMGRFEQAHRSTIFLDEIGDLPLELQPKLLRVLQEREIHRVGGVESVQLDVRVIAATNVDLWSRVNEGSFREDLFYRINVFPIHLPPLRERREDIPLFVSHFLEKFCRRDHLAPKRLRPPAEAELMGRPWLGNIRELENAVEIAVIRSQDREEVDASDFPAARGPFRSPAFAAAAVASDFKGMVTQFEKDLILRVLERTNGNKSQAASILRLKRTTLLEKLKKFESETEAEAAL